MLALYHNAASTCSQKVRLVLAEKGLEFESREIDLIGGGQHDPEYVKLNPNHVVPTLIHDDAVLIEFEPPPFTDVQHYRFSSVRSHVGPARPVVLHQRDASQRRVCTEVRSPPAVRARSVDPSGRRRRGLPAEPRRAAQYSRRTVVG